MYKSLLKVAFSIFSLMTISATSQAAAVTYNFSVSNIKEVFGSVSPPISSVAGSFTLDGKNLIAIDLTIGNHTYLLSEVGFTTEPSSSSFFLGGNVNGLTSLQGLTNDFQLGGLISHVPFSILAAASFIYTVPSSPLIYSSYSVGITSAPAVPLPSTVFLFASALVGFVGAFRRRK